MVMTDEILLCENKLIISLVLTCMDCSLISGALSFSLGSGNSVTDLEAGACGKRRAGYVAGVCRAA